MKIAFVELIYLSARPIDVGALMCNHDDHEVLGYMGQTLMEDGWDLDLDLLRESYPAIAQVNDLIPQSTMAEADQIVREFIEDYLDEGEELILVSRTEGLKDDLPSTTSVASIIFDPSLIEPMFKVFGVESEHYHEADRYAEENHRAVRSCVYNHAEFIVYRNNLIGWAEEMSPLH